MAATRWSNETEHIHAHGAYVNLIENTFSRHEDAIVDLIEKYNVKRSFITGHSLGGGLANVAHLLVRGQLKKAGSPWAKLDGKVDWLCLSFAAPQTIVRLYEPARPHRTSFAPWTILRSISSTAAIPFPGLGCSLTSAIS